MASQSPFVPPRQTQAKLRDLTNVIQLSTDSSSSTSTTEEDMQQEGMDSDIEYLIREETRLWLATHGAKLFGLEASKFLAAESKRKTVRGKR